MTSLYSNSSRFLSEEELEYSEYWPWYVAESEIPLLQIPAEEHVRDQRTLPVTRAILVNLVSQLLTDSDMEAILWIYQYIDKTSI